MGSLPTPYKSLWSNHSGTVLITRNCWFNVSTYLICNIHGELIITYQIANYKLYFRIPINIKIILLALYTGWFTKHTLKFIRIPKNQIYLLKDHLFKFLIFFFTPSSVLWWYKLLFRKMRPPIFTENYLVDNFMEILMYDVPTFQNSNMYSLL